MAKAGSSWRDDIKFLHGQDHWGFLKRCVRRDPLRVSVSIAMYELLKACAPQGDPMEVGGRPIHVWGSAPGDFELKPYQRFCVITTERLKSPFTGIESDTKVTHAYDPWCGGLRSDPDMDYGD